MQQRSVFGWLLVGAFCAAISCGGGNNSSNPLGFGVPCTSNKACASYELLCGTDGKCVECRGDGDCATDELCLKGLCAVQDDCSDSRDCKGDQVCDENAGVCVECLSSRDCATGQKCASNACEDRPVCKFTSDCTDGLVCDIDLDACVTCRNDDDCGTRRVCEDYECVTPKPAGTAGSNSGGTGSGGKAGTAGSGTGGSGTAGTSTAGTASGGAGFGGMSGSGGTVGEGGEGGALDCGCSLNQACTPDLRCVSPNLIDDLVDCDNEILSIAGRQGDWAADADIGIAFSSGFNDPGVSFGDRTCAAWASGSELTLNNPDTTFAFTGFLLNDGAQYDLSPYTGLQIQLEAPTTSVQVVLKTSGGGYFQYTLTPINSASSYTRMAPFASMLMMNNSAELSLDLSTVTEVQFSVTTPKSFKFAVHSVTLY